MTSMTNNAWEMAVREVIGNFGGVKKPTAINSAENYIIKNVDTYGPLYGVSVEQDDDDYNEWFFGGLREQFLEESDYCGCC